MDISKGLCMGCMSEIGEEQICPNCGFDNSNIDNGSGLPARTKLGKYLIGTVLDSGGEGITYIGKDVESGETVRIREFFPGDLCDRNYDGTVDVKRENSFSFNESLLCFLDLAKNLSSHNGSAHLLDVIDIFEAGGTAYYVTKSVSGITLREFLLRNGGQLTWEQARSLFLPLMPVLSSLHENNIVHRGLSPETLIVGRDGKVRITGFCIAAARTAKSDISARLFPGFAAIEQYGFDAPSGPWTDVYGLAATLFRTLVGNPPPEATDRVNNDNMTIPAKLAEGIPTSVLSSLAAALQTMPENRTQSIEEFKGGLLLGTPKPQTETSEIVDAAQAFFKKYGVLTIAGVATVLLLVIALVIGKNWNGIFGGDGIFGDIIQMPTSSEYIVNEENEVATVIDYKGMTCAEVIKHYEEQGFDDIEIEVVEKKYSDEYARGEIYSQTQEKGHEIGSGEVLKVCVSLGPTTVKLPDFVKNETDYRDAKIKLLELGFLAENIKEVAVSKLGEEENKVFEMSPKGGENVSPESVVEISYYKVIEALKVPDFVGKNYEQIRKSDKYSAFQFDITEVTSEVYDEGIIIEQSIKEGTKIKNTQVITLTVSSGKPPSMPSVTGKLRSDAVNLLNKKGISYSIVEQYDQSVAAGRVIKATPATGTTVTGSATLYISKGPKPVESATQSSEAAGNESSESTSQTSSNSSASSSTASE